MFQRKRSVSTRIGWTFLCAAGVVLPGYAGNNSHHHHDRKPVKISITAPESPNFQGITTNTGWSLVLRIETPHSVAIVETPEEQTQPIGRREAIVLSDPDGCLDMRHFPILRAGIPYEDCDGPDEEFLEFTTERFDTFDIADSNTGNFQVRERLVDEPFVDGAMLNKPYLRNTAGQIVPVPRPQTGGNLLDGFGYGPDDDLPGLVVMADIGAARVFDTNFDRTDRWIRNMGGFVNGVSQELLAKRGGSALTAHMQMVAGMFEPIALFDLDVDDPNVDYLRRVDNGKVRAFKFRTPPANNDAILREITSSYSPYELEVRVAIVEGVAPTFIRDANRDGRFTVEDLKKMGHRVISNEERLRLVVQFDLPITETTSGRTCPPPSLIYVDLDGNGRDGAISCSGSGGAARVKRVPV